MFKSLQVVEVLIPKCSSGGICGVMLSHTEAGIIDFERCPCSQGVAFIKSHKDGVKLHCCYSWLLSWLLSVKFHF